ncbi:hypothetical protein PSTT_08169 [Puccinia striiformis]|uniref:RING-type E3 ubiquitin transferase n=1 Tax=Puccinia striiformis TaxID=27350 RepID=A0A2S4VDN7_9BASI|nr:hypothetical protein PSTT_08169 [Puccinia striiformis]
MGQKHSRPETTNTKDSLLRSIKRKTKNKRWKNPFSHRNRKKKDQDEIVVVAEEQPELVEEPELEELIEPEQPEEPEQPLAEIDQPASPARRIYVQGMVVVRNLSDQPNQTTQESDHMDSLPTPETENQPIENNTDIISTPPQPPIGPSQVQLEQATMISRLLSAAAAATAASLLPYAIHVDGTTIQNPPQHSPRSTSDSNDIYSSATTRIQHRLPTTLEDNHEISENEDEEPEDDDDSHPGLQIILRDALRAAFGGALISPSTDPTPDQSPRSLAPSSPISSSPHQLLSTLPDPSFVPNSPPPSDALFEPISTEPPFTHTRISTSSRIMHRLRRRRPTIDNSSSTPTSPEITGDDDDQLLFSQDLPATTSEITSPPITEVTTLGAPPPPPAAPLSPPSSDQPNEPVQSLPSSEDDTEEPEITNNHNEDESITTTISPTRAERVSFNFFRMHRFEGIQPPVNRTTIPTSTNENGNGNGVGTNEDTDRPGLIPVLLVGIGNNDLGHQTDGSTGHNDNDHSSQSNATSDNLNQIDDADISAPIPVPESTTTTTDTPSPTGPAPRSWLIFVLAGLYPESHPIFTAPSLFIPNGLPIDRPASQDQQQPQPSMIASEEAGEEEGDDSTTPTDSSDLNRTGLIRRLRQPSTPSNNNPESRNDLIEEALLDYQSMIRLAELIGQSSFPILPTINKRLVKTLTQDAIDSSTQVKKFIFGELVHLLNIQSDGSGSVINNDGDHLVVEEEEEVDDHHHQGDTQQEPETHQEELARQPHDRLNDSILDLISGIDVHDLEFIDPDDHQDHDQHQDQDHGQGQSQGHHVLVLQNTLEKCLICLDEYLNEDSVQILSCKHMFHKHCVDQWLTKSSDSCPVCRRPAIA